MWCNYHSRLVKMTNRNAIIVTLASNDSVKVKERNILRITLLKCKNCTYCLNSRTVKLVKLMKC